MPFVYLWNIYFNFHIKKNYECNLTLSIYFYSLLKKFFDVNAIFYNIYIYLLIKIVRNPFKRKIYALELFNQLEF